MSNRLYAHSREQQPPEAWQPLEEHLCVVVRRASDFATQFSYADWAWNAGCLQDLGKATNAFQKYLLHSNELDDTVYDDDGSEFNHASMGVVLVEEQTQMFYSAFSQMREEISSSTVTESPALPPVLLPSGMILGRSGNRLFCIKVRTV